MSWLGPAALVVVGAILVLPGATPARLAVLARGGRLHPSTPSAAIEGPVVSGAPSGRRVGVAAVAVCLALLTLAGPAAATEAAIVLAVGGVLVGDVRRGRAATARLGELRAAVGLLESELQAGTAPPRALLAAAEHSPRLAFALAPAADAALCGGDAVGVLTGSGDADLRRLGVAWRVGEATGIPLADVLATLGSDLRSAAEQRRAVSVAVAGPQASAALLCVLPVLGIGLGIAMGARPLPLLFATPAGQVLMCVGLLLDAAGVLWVRRILRRAQA